VEEITNTNRNFRRLVEGIISIRRQYLQMVQFSQQEQVLRNPNLNLDLLELEEKLLATRLLTIDDVKNPEGIADGEGEVRRVEEVLLRVLDIHRLDPVFAVVDKASVEVVNEKEEHRPSASRASVLLNGLARLAELDRHLYHAQDGKSMVSLKWEKTLVPQQEGKQLPTDLKEELNVARIFRRVYREVFEFVAARESRLRELFKGSVLADRLELVDALCRIGLNEQAVGHMEKLSESAIASVAELPPSKFASLLHVLNNIGIFVNSDALHSAVKDRLAADLDQE
jgi:nicotinamidase-related amidase